MKLNLWLSAAERAELKYKTATELFEARKKRLSDWHPYYAWYPVRVGAREFRWLEKVERRVKFTEDFWTGLVYEDSEFRVPLDTIEA